MVISQAQFHEIYYTFSDNPPTETGSNSFDDRGAGYSPLVLKRLNRTVAGHGYIRTDILESSDSHDGDTAGIFLLKSSAQEALTVMAFILLKSRLSS